MQAGTRVVDVLLDLVNFGAVHENLEVVEPRLSDLSCEIISDFGKSFFCFNFRLTS